MAAPTRIDCLGTCRDGRCDGRCPQQGDHVTFQQTGADGGLVVRNDTDGRSYTCALDSQAPNPADCATVGPGRTGVIGSLGLDGRFCTGASFGTIGVTVDELPGRACDFHCGVLVLPSCTAP